MIGLHNKDVRKGELSELGGFVDSNNLKKLIIIPSSSSNSEERQIPALPPKEQARQKLKERCLSSFGDKREQNVSQYFSFLEEVYFKRARNENLDSWYERCSETIKEETEVLGEKSAEYLRLKLERMHGQRRKNSDFFKKRNARAKQSLYEQIQGQSANPSETLQTIINLSAQSGLYNRAYVERLLQRFGDLETLSCYSSKYDYPMGNIAVVHNAGDNSESIGKLVLALKQIPGMSFNQTTRQAREFYSSAYNEDFFPGKESIDFRRAVRGEKDSLTFKIGLKNFVDFFKGDVSRAMALASLASDYTSAGEFYNQESKSLGNPCFREANKPRNTNAGIINDTYHTLFGRFLDINYWRQQLNRFSDFLAKENQEDMTKKSGGFLPGSLIARLRDQETGEGYDAPAYRRGF